MVEAIFITGTETLTEKFESLDQVAERAKQILGLRFHRAFQHSGRREKKKKEDRRRY